MINLSWLKCYGSICKCNCNCKEFVIVICNYNLLTNGALRSSYELVETCPCVQDRIGIWTCWFLRRGENRSTRGKTSPSKGEDKQQTQPIYCVDAGIWTRATSEGGERFHHCATLAPLSCLHKSFLIFPGKSSKIAYSHCTLTWLRSQCTRLKENILKINHYVRDTELGFSFFWSFNCIFLHFRRLVWRSVSSLSPP